MPPVKRDNHHAILIRWTNAEGLAFPWRKFASVRVNRSLLCGSCQKARLYRNKRQQLKQHPSIKFTLLGCGLRLRQMLVLNDRNAAIGVSNSPHVARIDSGTRLRTGTMRVQILSWGPILAMALLSGCATVSDNPREISGITTFHPSQRTTVFFVCEKYYRKDDAKHEHEHIHCDKDRLINFKFSF